MNMKPKQKKETIRKLRAFFEPRPEIIFSYLHGSFVEGISFRDIDIAVYVDKTIIHAGKEIDYGIDISIEAEAATKVTPIDLKVINNAPIAFQFHSTKGILLFSKDDEVRTDFLATVWSLYYDQTITKRDFLKEMLGG